MIEYFRSLFFRKRINIPIRIDEMELYSSIYINLYKSMPVFESYRSLYNHIVFVEDGKELIVWGD